MPAFSDGFFLVFFLKDSCDFWVAVHGFEEPIDVDGTETAGEVQVVLGCDGLVAQDNHGVFRECCLDRIELGGILNVCTQNFGTQSACERSYLHLNPPAFATMLAQGVQSGNKEGTRSPAQRCEPVSKRAKQQPPDRRGNTEEGDPRNGRQKRDQRGLPMGR